MLRKVFSQTGAASRRARDERRTCKTASIPAFSPPLTPPRTAASRSILRAVSVLNYHSHARPRTNTIAWSQKDWASSINRASPSSLSKIAINILATACDARSGGLPWPAEAFAKDVIAADRNRSSLFSIAERRFKYRHSHSGDRVSFARTAILTEFVPQGLVIEHERLFGKAMLPDGTKTFVCAPAFGAGRAD